MSEQSIVAIVVALIGALAAIAVAVMSGSRQAKSRKAKTQNRKRKAAEEPRSAAPSIERAIVRLLIVIIYGAAGFFGLTGVLAFTDRAYLTGAALIVSALTFALSAHYMEEGSSPTSKLN